MIVTIETDGGLDWTLRFAAIGTSKTWAPPICCSDTDTGVAIPGALTLT
jgi:hypothetical protein